MDKTELRYWLGKKGASQPASIGEQQRDSQKQECVCDTVGERRRLVWLE